MIRLRQRWAAWLILLLVFLFNQVLEYREIRVPLLYSYLDDLLALPVVLGAFHLLQIILFRKPQTYTLSFSLCLLAVAGFIFHFEILLPRFSGKYTADILDALMYAAGGLLYMLLLNGSGKKFRPRAQS